MKERLIIGSGILPILALGLFLALYPPTPAHSSADSAVIGGAMPSVDVRRSMLVTNTQTYTSYLPLVRHVSCSVGSTVEDAVNDVIPAHIDITEATSRIDDTGQISVTFRLRDVPPSLPFNRSGVPRLENRCYMEYSWSTFVDADNSRTTGWRGYDYWLSAFNCPGENDLPTTAPIPDVIEARVGYHDPSCGESCFNFANNGTIVVDSSADTLTLRGTMPGISSTSPTGHEAYDYNPGGTRQTDVAFCFREE